MADIPVDLQKRILERLQPIMEEWSGGQKLKWSNIYGMRRYLNGGLMNHHTDIFGKNKI